MHSPFPSAVTVTRASLLVLLAAPLAAQSADRLDGKNVSITQTNYKGRSAIQLIAAPDAQNATSYAVVRDVLFRDGTIEVDLAGQPGAGAGSGARGFIGIAFRLQPDGRYEYIYLRPTNGRADDQVRRNHSTQYSSHPDFDFARSRQEAPEKYESYVDLEPGVWTKYRIEVEGRKGAALRERSGATLPHRQRSEARAARRTSRVVGRTRYRGLLCQSEDRGEVIERRRGRLRASLQLPAFEVDARDSALGVRIVDCRVRLQLDRFKGMIERSSPFFSCTVAGLAQ
jgi:hypothetical protein